MKKNMLKIISLFALLSLVLAACGVQAEPTPAPEAQGVISSNDVVAEGRLEPIAGVNLSMQARGVVEAVLVKAGDTVRQGDVLVRLASAEAAEARVLVAQNQYDALLRTENGDRAKLWQAYMAAQSARAKAEKKWQDLNVENIDDDIEDRKATVEDRQQDVTDAQDEFEKYKDLAEDNSKRKDAEDKLENAQDDLSQALRDLEAKVRERDEVLAAYETSLGAEAEAKHQYESSLDGPNPDQLAVAKANLDGALDVLSNLVITAPFDGVIADVNVKPGEQVGPETRAVSIADFGSWVVETTDVTELEVVKISVGQSVVLIPDALPDLALNGVVSEISQAYTQQGGDILYTVRIAVLDSDPRLKWGMTMETTFKEVVK